MINLQLDKSGNEIFVSGKLDFENVAFALEQLCAFIDSASQKTIVNFSKLQQSNSAGLALMTNLLRYAKKKHKSIYFSNIPDKLLSAAKMSNLDEILLCAQMT
jgi:phospholipid transport system transporter-binding protein